MPTASKLRVQYIVLFVSATREIELGNGVPITYKYLICKDTYKYLQDFNSVLCLNEYPVNFIRKKNGYKRISN